MTENYINKYKKLWGCLAKIVQPIPACIFTGAFLSYFIIKPILRR
jgi:hypothetical protein